MKYLFAATGVWLLTVSCVQAQMPERRDGISAEMIGKVLRQLKLTSVQKKEVLHLTLRGYPLTLTLEENGARLLARATLQGTLGAADLRQYNEQCAAVAQVRQDAGALQLHAELEFRPGLGEVHVRKFLLGFGQDMREFADLVHKPSSTPNPAAGGPQGEDFPKEPRRKTATTRVLLEALSHDEKTFEVSFPTGDVAWETRWKIEWDMETIAAARKDGMKFPSNRTEEEPVLFKIKKASFKPGRKAPWVQVLKDAHPSELYVPYYFRDTRFFDLRDAGCYVELDPSEGGARGCPLGKERLVMAEIRDRGVAYKNGAVTRRAEELTLWANFNAGNYTYLLEFGFMDDGTIALRHAPTGYNLPRESHVAHMHNCCWRIGLSLGLEGRTAVNTAALARWPSNTPHAPDAGGEANGFGIEPIKNEGFRDWQPREFTKIRVTNPDVVLGDPDGKGLPIAYDLVPMVSGIARHPRAEESFSQHDFWITHAESPIRQYIHLGDYFAKNKGRTLGGGPLVLWHMSSLLHVPRSEDGIRNGSSINHGQALASWTIVELRPRNLFDGTPIYRGVR